MKSNLNQNKISYVWLFCCYMQGHTGPEGFGWLPISPSHRHYVLKMACSGSTISLYERTIWSSLSTAHKSWDLVCAAPDHTYTAWLAVSPASQTCGRLADAIHLDCMATPIFVIRKRPHIKRCHRVPNFTVKCLTARLVPYCRNFQLIYKLSVEVAEAPQTRY